MTESQKITKDMLIGDAVSDFPSAADVLMQAGVRCVGCGGAYMETIEEGLKGHGKTDEEIAKIIEDMNSSVPEELGEKDKLIITTTAVKKLKELMKQQNITKGGLRIGVEPGGCSGFQYVLVIDEAKEGDEIITIDGVQFMLDEESYTQLKGAKVDYLEGLQGAGFKISNPNANHSCGCGDSFH